MNNDNATFVFETLLRQKEFMEKVDLYIKEAMTDGKIQSKDIPQLVLLVVTLLTMKKEKIMNKNDTFDLLQIFQHYIINKVNIEFNVKEFINIYNICVRLAMLKMKFSDKSTLFCVK